MGLLLVAVSFSTKVDELRGQLSWHQETEDEKEEELKKDKKKDKKKEKIDGYLGTSLYSPSCWCVVKIRNGQMRDDRRGGYIQESTRYQAAWKPIDPNGSM